MSRICIVLFLGSLAPTLALSFVKKRLDTKQSEPNPDVVALALSGNGCLSETTQLGFAAAFQGFKKLSLVATNSGGSWLTASLLYAPKHKVTVKEAQAWLTRPGAYDTDGRFGTMCVAQYLASASIVDEKSANDFLTQCFEWGGGDDHRHRQFGVVDWCARGESYMMDRILPKLQQLPSACLQDLSDIALNQLPEMRRCLEEGMSTDASCMEEILGRRVFAAPECGLEVLAVREVFQTVNISASQKLSDVPAATMTNYHDPAYLRFPTWAMCQARYSSNYGRMEEDIWHHVKPGRTIVDPAAIGSALKRNLSAQSTIGHSDDLLANVLASSSAMIHLALEQKFSDELLVNIPKPDLLGSTPTGSWLMNPKSRGGMVSDCASLENTGVLTAIKMIDDQEISQRPGLLVSLISEDNIYYVNTFFVERFDYFEDKSIGQAETRMPYLGDEGRTGLGSLGTAKNHNRIFRMVSFDDDGLQLHSSAQRSAKLKQCFGIGSCLMKVRVLSNSFWAIIGGWEIWLHVVMQRPKSTIVSAFKQIVPRTIKNDLRETWPAKHAADFTGMNRATAWAYMNMGSLYGLHVLCEQDILFEHGNPQADRVNDLMDRAHASCSDLTSLAKLLRKIKM